MVEICHAIHTYAKANNKHLKNYDKDIQCNPVESSYFIHLDKSNLYGWGMSQKLPVNGFKWEESIHKSKEDFITNYDENCNKGYFFEVDVAYPKNLFIGIAFNLHMDLPFLSKRKKIRKCNKLVCNIHDKENYVVHIRALKQA